MWYREKKLAIRHFYLAHILHHALHRQNSRALAVCKDSFFIVFNKLNFTLLLHGMAISTYLSGESVLHRAMVGMLTYEASVSG